MRAMKSEALNPYQRISNLKSIISKQSSAKGGSARLARASAKRAFGGQTSKYKIPFRDLNFKIWICLEIRN